MRCMARAVAGGLCLVLMGLSGTGCNLFQGDFTHHGGYFGLGYNQGLEDFDVAGLTPEDPPGFGVRVGYRGNPYFAGEFSLDYNTDFFEEGSSDAAYAGLGLKHFPLSYWRDYSRVQPYVTAGLGVMGIDVPVPGGGSEASLALRYGLGVDVYLTRNLLLFSEFLAHSARDDDLDDLDFYNWVTGFQVRFGP